MTKADWDSFFSSWMRCPRASVSRSNERLEPCCIRRMDVLYVSFTSVCLMGRPLGRRIVFLQQPVCTVCGIQKLSASQSSRFFISWDEIEDISESTGHRLETLLDVPWDEDGFMLTKLVRLIRLAKFKGYAVDCQQLLEDLFYWNGEKQSVQRKWARALYQKPEDSSNVQEGE